MQYVEVRSSDAITAQDVAVAAEIAYVYYENEPGRRSARCLFKRTQETNGGLVVLKTLAKLIFGGAALAVATLFGTSTSRAYGDAHRERRRVSGLPVSLVRRLLPQRQYFGGQSRFLQREPMAGTILGSPLQTQETSTPILIGARRIAVNLARLPELLMAQPHWR